MDDRKKFAWLVGVFLVVCFLPLQDEKVQSAILEGFRLLQWYALHHTLACVVPAMFIAGAISTFLSRESVMRYLGPDAGRASAYGVASVAGVVLAVCSCSVLPMFAGIYAMGAGLGPATAFLYSGPAINVMAVFLSARVLGFDLGLARGLGAVSFSVVIGLVMAWVFRHGDRVRVAAATVPRPVSQGRHLWKTALFFAAMVLFLVFSDWYNTNDVTVTLKDGRRFSANVRYDRRGSVDLRKYRKDGSLSDETVRIDKSRIERMVPKPGLTQTVYSIKWYLAGALGIVVLLMAWRWLSRDEIKEWMQATWDFGLLIVPLLFGGVFVTGFLGGVIPEAAVASLVGGNGLLANLVASVVGTIWYFATLTEIPIVDMLMHLGMGRGPALALLLAGPALSLPSILVINKVMGPKKTAVFCLLTVIMSTIVGMVFGWMD